MAAACISKLQGRCTSCSYILLSAKMHSLELQGNQRVRLLLLLFVSFSWRYMQHSRCDRGLLQGAWWRLRNKPFVEKLWTRGRELVSPSILDTDNVLLQMTFAPLGIFAFLQQTSSLPHSERLYAWHGVKGTKGVRKFLSKFDKVHVLVGKDDPVETLHELLGVLKEQRLGQNEARILDAIDLFRKAFFATASRMCDAIIREDNAELATVISKTFPLMRHCLYKLLQCTTSPSSRNIAAARLLLARWVLKLHRLDFAFLHRCPTAPAPLLTAYLHLGLGILPSEVVAISILKDIPRAWRFDPHLKTLVPAATLPVKCRDSPASQALQEEANLSSLDASTRPVAYGRIRPNFQSFKLADSV